LIFPIGGAQWLIVLPVVEPEIAAFQKQITTAVTAANRNQPGEMLPDIRLEEVGFWSLKGNKGEIWEQLCEEFQDGGPQADNDEIAPSKEKSLSVVRDY
jgi:hypothetical protein